MNTTLNNAQNVIAQISFAIEHRPEAVAQLFDDYDIQAPVNEGSVMDAIVVYKDPFLQELNAIIESDFDSDFVGKKKKAERQAKKQERQEKRQEKRENHSTSGGGSPFKKIVNVVRGKKGGNASPTSTSEDPDDDDNAPDPSPARPQSPTAGTSAKLNLGNVIDTAAAVTQGIKDTKNAVFSMKDVMQNRRAASDALNQPRNSGSSASTAAPKDDKLFGMPKYMAIGLIVVAILIVIFVIMRMKSK